MAEKDWRETNRALWDERVAVHLAPGGYDIEALHQIDAGMRLDWLHEHPTVTWRMFKSLVKIADGTYGWPDKPWLPLAFSLKATRT